MISRISFEYLKTDVYLLFFPNLISLILLIAKL